MMQALTARSRAHEAFDWRTEWQARGGPVVGPIGRTGSQVQAVRRVIEALTGDVPLGVAARAEIWRVNVLDDSRHGDVVVAERDAAGAIRWSGELGTVPPDVEAKLPGFPGPDVYPTQ